MDDDQRTSFGELCGYMLWMVPLICGTIVLICDAIGWGIEGGVAWLLVTGVIVLIILAWGCNRESRM